MNHRHDEHPNDDLSDPAELDSSNVNAEANDSGDVVEDGELRQIIDEWKRKHKYYNIAGKPFGAAGFEFWAHHGCKTTAN